MSDRFSTPPRSRPVMPSAPNAPVQLAPETPQSIRGDPGIFDQNPFMPGAPSKKNRDEADNSSAEDVTTFGVTTFGVTTFDVTTFGVTASPP